jgi:hypothetical protein
MRSWSHRDEWGALPHPADPVGDLLQVATITQDLRCHRLRVAAEFSDVRASLRLFTRPTSTVGGIGSAQFTTNGAAHSD